jgi:lysine 2,3-aminomutase
MAVPYYVIDAPGGGGKIPIVPNYLHSVSDEQVVLRNYAGELFVYPQVRPKKERRQRIVPCAAAPPQS